MFTEVRVCKVEIGEVAENPFSVILTIKRIEDYQFKAVVVLMFSISFSLWNSNVYSVVTGVGHFVLVIYNCYLMCTFY